MSRSGVEVTTEWLQAFADAFNRHDADAIPSFMTEDCVFEASAGPEVCGARFEGAEAVRAAFVDVCWPYAVASHEVRALDPSLSLGMTTSIEACVHRPGG